MTEVVERVRVARDSIDSFWRDARAGGLFPIPYTARFFKGNLHVYAFSGPLRGFDLAAISNTAVQSEQALIKRVHRLESRFPGEIARAQGDLLEGKRGARHKPDLRVLTARLKEAETQALTNRSKRRTL